MTQEDKDLLLKDLCARLPYEVEIYYSGTVPILTLKTINSEKGTCIAYDHSQWYRHSKFHIEVIKPYLRPMSSMTDEEKEEYDSIQCDFGIVRVDRVDEIVEFLLSHHFDFVRTNDGLTMIEAGLALEAPKGMYNIKEK